MSDKPYNQIVMEALEKLSTGQIVVGMTPDGGFTFTSDGELLTSDTEREQNTLNSYGKTMSSTGTSWTMFIDLSDTTNWHHTETGRIDISTLSLSVDKSSNAQGSVSLGVVTRVNTTNADVTLFFGKSFNNASEASIDIFRNYSPSQLKLGVVAGKTDRVTTTAVVLNETAIRTNLALDSFLGAGTVFPAIGDIVARFVLSAGTSYTAAMQCMYHGDATP